MTQQRLYRMTPPHTATVEWPRRAAHPLKHIVYHSPAGFAWGYGGSGRADLALSLLADHLGELRDRSPQWPNGYDSWLAAVEKTRAFALHQEFKWDVVAIYGQKETWSLTSEDIESWLSQSELRRAVAEGAVP